MKNRTSKLALFILSVILLININMNISKAENLEDLGYVEANEIILNDEKLELDGKALLKDGRTLVPGKALFEKLGFEFELDNENKMVLAKKDHVEIKLLLDTLSEGFQYKDIKVDLDVPATMFKGDVIVPIRVVGEILDLEVGWDSLNRNVLLKEVGENKISLEEAHSILIESEEGRFGKNIKMTFIHAPTLDHDIRSKEIIKNNYIFRVSFDNGRMEADYLYGINKNSGEVYLYLGDHSFQLMSDIENATGVVVKPRNLPVELELGKIFTSLEILKEDGIPFETEDIEELKIVEVGNEENIIGEMSKKEEVNKYNLNKYGDMYSIFIRVDILGKVDPEKEYMWLPKIKNEENRDNLNKIRFTNDPILNEVYINGEFRSVENSQGNKVNTFSYSLKNPILEIAVYDAVNLKDLKLLDVYLIDEKKNRLAEFNGKSVFGYDEINTLRPFIDIEVPIKDLGKGLYEILIAYDGKIIYRDDIYFVE